MNERSPEELVWIHKNFIKSYMAIHRVHMHDPEGCERKYFITIKLLESDKTTIIPFFSFAV